MTDLGRSNSLIDLAARIKLEHQAVAVALKDSLQHAVAAGELLIEGKAQVPHGQWLSWLKDHCTISERTAQLYMRVAKNRADIETKIADDTADLTLSEAAAMLALSSDVRKLFQFIKGLEGLDDPEDIVAHCVASNVPVIVDEGYDPFAGRSEEEKRDWLLFVAFLSVDLEAGRDGYEPKNAWCHVEWRLQRPFQNVAEWLGPEGDKFRRNPFNGGSVSEQFKTEWAAFQQAHSHYTVADAEQMLEALQKRFEEHDKAGRLEAHKPKRSRKRTRAA
jgi:Protein of unknown function (DUF3102)